METSTMHPKMDDRGMFRKGQSIIDYLDSHKGGFTMAPKVPMQPQVVDYLVSMIPKNLVIDEDRVKAEMEKLNTGKFFYKGGYSTIHISKELQVMDKFHELIAMQRIGELPKIPSMNIHFGMFHYALGEYAEKVEWKEIPPEPAKRVKSPYSLRAITLVMAYANETLDKQTDKTYKGSGRFTEGEAAEWIKKRDTPLLRECMGISGNIAKLSNKFLNTSEWAALRYITAVSSEDDSKVFFASLSPKVTLSDTHPITSLKRAFTGSIGWADNKASYRMRMVIQTWNAFRKGEKGQIAWDMISESPKAI